MLVCAVGFGGGVGKGKGKGAYCDSAAAHEELCAAEFVYYPVHCYDDCDEADESVDASGDEAGVCAREADGGEDPGGVVLFSGFNSRFVGRERECLR